MKALLLENTVVDIAKAEFEVHESMVWMNCSDDCEVGWKLIGGNLQEIIAVEETYDIKRKREYPSLLELTVALYDTDDKSAVEAKRAAVKLKYPKP
tara:strand:- start:63 stop:350 length:288 start_codon:yes stop_codon:yes gene_type:complete